MSPLFWVLVVLTALLVGVLIALVLLSRHAHTDRPAAGKTGSGERGEGGEGPDDVVQEDLPSPGPSPLARFWAQATQVVRRWLAGVTAWLGNLLRERASSRSQSPRRQESVQEERWEPPSWQERRGRLAMHRMLEPAGQGEETASTTPRRLSPPAFSRTVLLLIVVVIIVALAISLWRVGVGFIGAVPAPQFTILIATLPGSVQGQSSAELLDQLERDFAEAGLPPTLTLQVIPDQPTDAASAYALARSRQADLLVWGHVQADLIPGYFLTLTLTPHLNSRMAPEFPEYGSMMVTPAHFSLNRVGNRGLSKNELAVAITWLARFYTGRFDTLESLPPAEVRGNVPAALYQFHWMALRWLKGDYDGAKQAYADLGCPVEFVPDETPLSPRQQAERQVCLAAANNRAVTLITQESLGLIPGSSLDGAAATLASVVEVAPDMTMVWYNLGRAYLARGRWSEAMPPLVKAVQLAPGLAAAWAALSEASTEAGDLPRGHEAATRAVSLDGGLVTAHLAQGRYLLADNQPQEAEGVLDRALQLAEAEATRRRSQEAALREGPRANQERADFAAAWARRNDAMLARVHLARARVFLRQGEIEGQASFFLWLWRLIIGELSPLEKADVEIQAVRETHPDWSAVLRMQAQLLIASGSLDDAVVMLRQLQEQDPQDLGTYLDLIQVLRRQWWEYYQTGRTTEAQQKLAELRDQYQLLIDRNIDPVQGYFGLGDVAQRIGEWDTARQHYLQVIEVDDKYAEAYLRLGQVELETPDEAQALAYLDQALEASEKQGSVAVAAYCERGEILLEQYLRLKAQGEEGAIAVAQEAFEAARKLDGRAVRALNGLGRIAYETGNAAGAESLYRQAQAVNARDFDTVYGLGRVYEARGQSTAARDYLIQAVQAQPGSIAAHYHLGVAYYALLEEVLARQNLDWVQRACTELAQEKRPKADDTEACAGVEDWLKRITEGE
jgi:tetratricopeptide (TPR) repeat protein